MKPDHSFVCYDNGFQLMCSDMKTEVCCFRKELADHLSKSFAVIDIHSESNHDPSGFGDKSSFDNKFVFDGKSGFDNTTNPTCRQLFVNMEDVIIPPRMVGKNGNNYKNNKKNNNKISQDYETSDVSSQSRQNGTQSIVNALRKKRGRNSNGSDVVDGSGCLKGSPDLKPKDPKGKEEEVEWIDTEESEEFPKPQSEKPEEFQKPEGTKDKVCSVIANILRNKAFTKSNPLDIKPKKYLPQDIDKDSDTDTDTSDSDTDTNDSEGDIPEEMLPQIPILPSVPRHLVDNVHLSSLPQTLQKAVINTVKDMTDNILPIGTFYYNGATIAVLVDNDNVVNVFDWNNLIDAHRLEPKLFLSLIHI